MYSQVEMSMADQSTPRSLSAAAQPPSATAQYRLPSSALENAMIELNTHATRQVSSIALSIRIPYRKTHLLAIFRILSSISSSMPFPTPNHCLIFAQ